MPFLRKLFTKRRVFLDYASITPLDKRVRRVMQKFESDLFSNPSALYESALLSKEAVRQSRGKVAEILDTTKDSIIYTSGGTESNNLAILGTFEYWKKQGIVPHFITTRIEHPSALEVFKEIEARGGEVSFLEVDGNGVVNPKDITALLKPTTVLVSVMYANNEIGTIQPIAAIGRQIKEWRAKNSSKDFLPYFHTDASQAALYLPLNIHKLNVDLMTLDGIKIYGPRGTGVLFAKPILKMSSIVFGGGQERGLRSGTENVPAIVGFGEALSIADKLKSKESARLTSIRDYAISKILKKFPKAHLNGSQENRLPNNVNICFPGTDAEFSVIALDVHKVSASYSSSCRTLKEDSSSYVVESLGDASCALSSLRFTFGRETKKKDIDRLVFVLEKVIK